jgi:hypothetical protein
MPPGTLEAGRQLQAFPSLSTVKELVSFGLKPGHCLVFNYPVRQLADGVIDVRDIQGFSHIFLIFDTFLDQTHLC